MSLIVSGHGVEVSKPLKECCAHFTEDKLRNVVGRSIDAEWTLSLDSSLHSVHLRWKVGKFSGNVYASSEDMYKSLSEAADKAVKQMKNSIKRKRGGRYFTSIKEFTPVI